MRDLRVNRKCNVIDELYLECRNTCFVAIHHFDRPISHGFLEISLREKLPIHQKLQRIQSLFS